MQPTHRPARHLGRASSRGRHRGCRLSRSRRTGRSRHQLTLKSSDRARCPERLERCGERMALPRVCSEAACQTGRSPLRRRPLLCIPSRSPRKRRRGLRPSRRRHCRPLRPRRRAMSPRLSPRPPPRRPSRPLDAPQWRPAAAALAGLHASCPGAGARLLPNRGSDEAPGACRAVCTRRCRTHHRLAA